MEGPSAAPAGYKYPAFISYSHRDERWASWLHKGIEGYRVPKPLVRRPGRNGPIPKQIFPVFRDRDELASSADLPGVLRDALAQSGHLIVLCSPAAAQSRWVDEEIKEFKRLGRGDRILPLIVDGEPHATALGRECFPPALRFQVDSSGRLTNEPAEPIAADLRPGADGKENAKLKLIASLLGVSFNDLRQRELIAARRRARIWQGICAALLLLALLAAAGGWMAWRYAQHAEGLLAEAIRISADQVGGAVNVADQQGVSRKAIEELLARAEAAFNGLYGRIAAAPALPWRQSIVPPRLRGQNAVRLLALADLYGKLGNIERQREMAERARSELAKVVDEEPYDPEWRVQLALSHDLIAGAQARKWQVADALASYRAALTIREGLAAADPGHVGWQKAVALSHASIGDILFRQGRWAAALEAYQAALAIGERMAAGAPMSPDLERDLAMIRQRVGDMLLKQGEYGAAETSYRIALASAERLAAAEPTNVQAQWDLSVSLAKLGNALERQGQIEPALAQYEASLAIIEPLAAEDRANKLDLQRDVFKTYELIGNLRLDQGALDAAMVAFEAALTIAEQRAAADPSDSLAQRELSVQRNHLGDVLEAQGQADAALAEYRKALHLRRALAAIDPTNAQAQRDLSLSHARVGDVLRKQARWPEALVELEASLAIARRLAADEPSNRQWQQELALAHLDVARVLDDQGRSDAALEDYQAALVIAEQLALAEPSDVTAQRDLLARFVDLAEVQERNGSRAEAQRSYCHARVVVVALTGLEPGNDEWRERRTWVEERLRATQDGGAAPC
jgi:eukaryotic-like serine/threonine-protein kinase